METNYTMARFRSEWRGSRLIEIFAISFLMASLFVSTKGSLEQEASSYSEKEEVESDYYVMKVLNFFWQPGRLGYTHVWPVSPTFVLLYWFFVLNHVFGY